MSLEKIRVSQQARDQLLTLKRRTKIEHWNVLCRWALCVSLREKTRPRTEGITGDSSVEMTWHTFAGDHEDVYLALIKQRCHADGLPTDIDTVSTQFRAHLHRGIAYLVGDRSLKTISDLVSRCLPAP